MESLLKIENVTKHYPDFTLDHISFDIPKDVIYGMIGENGAGKTTLISALMDMIKIDEGQIEILNMDHLIIRMPIKLKNMLASSLMVLIRLGIFILKI